MARARRGDDGKSRTVREPLATQGEVTSFLGQLPAHWRFARFAALGAFFKGGGGTKADEVDEGVPCVRYGDLYTTHRNFIRSTRARIAPERADAYTPIRFGDVLFAASGETFGEIGRSAVCLIDSEVRAGGDVVIFRPAVEFDPRFLGYVADSPPVAAQKAAFGTGTIIKHIDAGALKNVIIPVPPLTEQKAIATFLDRKAEKIDALIAKKERLIALLLERRQALIADVIRGGVRADVVVTRESGVPWLGRIPSHWAVRRLKVAANINPETLPAGTDPASELTYVDIGGVDELGRIHERVTMTFGAAPSRARRIVREGDAVISTVRTYLRSIAGISPAEDGFIVSTGFAVVRPRDGLLPGYLAYALRAPFFVERVVAASKGVSFPAIEESELGIFELPIPPEAEQASIALFLDRQTARIDGLIVRVRVAIEKLKELRAASVTAAVTGQFDVREYDRISA